MISLKRIIEPGTQISDSWTDLYTTPSGTNTMLQRVSLFNNHTDNNTIEIRLLQAGGTTGVVNNFKKITLVPEQDIPISELEGHILAVGDILQMKASTTATVNVFGSAVEQTK